MNKFKKIKYLFSLIFVIGIMFIYSGKVGAFSLFQDGNTITHLTDYMIPLQKIGTINNQTSEKVYCMDRQKDYHYNDDCYVENSTALSDTQSLAIGALINKVNKLGKDEYFAATMAINCYAGVPFSNNERSRFCDGECTADICKLSQQYYNELKNYTAPSTDKLTANTTKLNFTKSGDFYVAEFKLSSSASIKFDSTVKGGIISGTNQVGEYIVKIPVDSVTAGQSIKVTATKSVTLNYATKYICSAYQPVARLEPKPSNTSVSLSGTIPEEQPKKGRIRIKKVDSSNTSTELSGGQFRLHVGDDCTGTVLTVGGANPFEINGTITISNLDLSKTYSIYEETAPEGYDLPVDRCVIKSAKPTIETQEPETRVVKNDKEVHPELEVRKEDSSGEKNYKGVVLVLYDKASSNIPIDIWTLSTSNSRTYSKGLTIGHTYCVKEVAAPEEYQIAKFDESKHCVTLTNNTPTATITVTNTKKPKPKLDILKVDSKDLSTGIEGATLRLYKGKINYNDIDLDKKDYIDEWTTTTSARSFNNLDQGWYTIIEVKAPDGYLLSKTPVYKELKNGGSYTVKFENTKNTISIKKVDADDETKYVEGAILHIEDEKYNKIGKSWTTKGEAHEIEKLEPGIYYLVEEKAPDGYLLNTEKKRFVVPENVTEVITVKMTNRQSEVEISKQDATTGKELPGATLKLTDEKGNVIEEWVSIDKPYVIKGLKDGKYKLTETIAPEGYTLSTKTVEFEVKEGKVDKKVVMTNELTPVPSTGGSRSTLLLFVAMLDIALGIGIITYVRKNRLQQ